MSLSSHPVGIQNVIRLHWIKRTVFLFIPQIITISLRDFTGTTITWDNQHLYGSFYLHASPLWNHLQRMIHPYISVFFFPVTPRKKKMMNLAEINEKNKLGINNLSYFLLDCMLASLAGVSLSAKYPIHRNTKIRISTDFLIQKKY